MYPLYSLYLLYSLYPLYSLYILLLMYPLDSLYKEHKFLLHVGELDRTVLWLFLKRKTNLSFCISESQ